MAKAEPTVQEGLMVERRPVRGTRAVRRLRTTALVPGVVYGKGMDPLGVAVPGRELARLLSSKAGGQVLVKLRLSGEGAAWERPALIKAVQHDPVDGHILHVDFHAIVLTERLRVKVPVVLKGEPVGVKQDGGILEHFLREVEVECLPTDIPGQVEFDASPLRVGEAVHVRDLVPPKHARITGDPAGVVASVLAPKEEQPEEAAAVTEPEVIREKKEEAAAAEPVEGKPERPEPKDAKS